MLCEIKQPKAVYELVVVDILAHLMKSIADDAELKSND